MPSMRPLRLGFTTYTILNARSIHFTECVTNFGLGVGDASLRASSRSSLELTGSEMTARARTVSDGIDRNERADVSPVVAMYPLVGVTVACWWGAYYLASEASPQTHEA